ncbi:hypothetical protein [Ruegeria sp. HKCCD8929]|uniref:hypothetical protein n=1 Tax=Ruegeria sp. HKCCD8929 TaxID=2683006 RepID=UPI0014893CD4|nr:hypothetical protein [Ruegeria sp. HKCCD8929]
MPKLMELNKKDLAKNQVKIGGYLVAMVEESGRRRWTRAYEIRQGPFRLEEEENQEIPSGVFESARRSEQGFRELQGQEEAGGECAEIGSSEGNYQLAGRNRQTQERAAEENEAGGEVRR